MLKDVSVFNFYLGMAFKAIIFMWLQKIKLLELEKREAIGMLKIQIPELLFLFHFNYFVLIHLLLFQVKF